MKPKLRGRAACAAQVERAALVMSSTNGAKEREPQDADRRPRAVRSKSQALPGSATVASTAAMSGACPRRFRRPSRPTAAAQINQRTERSRSQLASRETSREPVRAQHPFRRPAARRRSPNQPESTRVLLRPDMYTGRASCRGRRFPGISASPNVCQASRLSLDCWLSKPAPGRNRE